jgi:hypothetical protein
LNFRDDGAAALEWAASYLERVRELPVLAQVEPGEIRAALPERVSASGEAFLSHTALAGRYVLRLAIGNARTTEEDVRRAWEVLRREVR